MQPGDTLSAIARRYETTVYSLCIWNAARYPSLDPNAAAFDPGLINVGWELRVRPGVIVPGTLPTPRPTPTPTRTATHTATPRPTAAPTPTPAGASALVSHGSRSSRQVALTFDMGGRLDPALDIMRWLATNRVPATVFPTGQAASTAIGSQVLARIKAEPALFALGNHSWNHPDFTTLTAAQIRDQLVRTEALVVERTGRSTQPYFRPPYGAYNRAVLTSVGAAGWRMTIAWDVDTIDWRPVADGGPTPQQIVDKVVSRAQGGSIVLMHLGGYNTFQALPGIVAGLRERGLEPVTLTTLLRE